MPFFQLKELLGEFQSLATKSSLGYMNRLQNTLSYIYKVVSEPINTGLFVTNLTNRPYLMSEQMNVDHEKVMALFGNSQHFIK